MQKLKPAGHSQRRRYVEWLLEQHAMEHISHSVDMLIKKNCHIWGSEDPQVIEKKPLHPEKVTVWCAL